MDLQTIKQKHYDHLDKMIRIEAEEIMDMAKRHKTRKSWNTALEEARERVETWIAEARQEERLDLGDALSIARFIGSVRISKAWATFIGLA